MRRISGVMFGIPLVRNVSEDIFTYNLNETAREIIECIESDGVENSIIDKMHEHYPAVNREEISSDVLECISDLKEVGIIEEV